MENLFKEQTFLTPSGYSVTIREQNGEDDDIISRMKDVGDNSALNKFLSGIITNCELSNGRVTANDILKWKNKDKYYVLFKSRLFSIGNEITFDHECTSCGKKTSYEESLTQYDRDFSKGEEGKTDFTFQVTPYPKGMETTAELTLSSGKVIKIDYLNGLGEKKLLEFNKEEISKNTELLVRNIQWLNGEKFQKLENFRVLSTKDMSEIRKHLLTNDTQFEAVSELKCPFCNNKDHISLLTQPDFFFPREI